MEPKRRYNTKFGEHAFAVASRTARNRVPAGIRQLQTTYAFKRHLKADLL